MAVRMVHDDVRGSQRASRSPREDSLMQAESPDLGTPVLFAGTEIPAHVVLPQLSEHHPTVTPISRLSRDLLRLGYTIVSEV